MFVSSICSWADEASKLHDRDRNQVSKVMTECILYRLRMHHCLTISNKYMQSAPFTKRAMLGAYALFQCWLDGNPPLVTCTALPS